MTYTHFPARTARRQPAFAGRRPLQLLRLAVLLAALFGVTLAIAGPASALGYPIRYSVRNATSQTLHFVSAHAGGGGKCLPGSTGLPVCFDKKVEFSVSPGTVRPGEALTVNSELDIFSFRQEGNITATYRIGESGNDRVVLHSTPHEAQCRVEGTRAYRCDVQPGNAGRDFVLSAV